MSNIELSMVNCSLAKEVPAIQMDCLVGDISGNNISNEYLRFRIVKRLCSLLEEFDSVTYTYQDVKSWLDYFLDVYYPETPASLQNRDGSTDMMGLLILYLAARAICPDLIVESGVFIGSSLHMFSQNFTHVPIYAFDINLKKLMFEPSDVVLVESDWCEYSGFPSSDNGFAFFDDHINCAKRVLECKMRGIRWAVFDDAPAIGNIPRYRYPAIPSIYMIMDTNLPVNCVFEWFHNPTNTSLRYVFDAEQAEQCACARKSICKAVSLDVFSEITGTSCGDKWLVEIDV